MPENIYQVSQTGLAILADNIKPCDLDESLAEMSQFLNIGHQLTVATAGFHMRGQLRTPHGLSARQVGVHHQTGKWFGIKSR